MVASGDESGDEGPATPHLVLTDEEDLPYEGDVEDVESEEEPDEAELEPMDVALPPGLPFEQLPLDVQMALDPALEAFAAREMFGEEFVVCWDDPLSSPVGHRTSSSGLSPSEVVSDASFTSLSSTTSPSISLSKSEG